MVEDRIPYKFDLGPRDHVFHYIYQAANLVDNGNTRYGMTVRASCVPEEIRLRSRVRRASDSTHRSGPLPTLGDDPYILFASGKKPEVDWTSNVHLEDLERLWREAQLRNQSPDWIFRRGLSLRLEGYGFEIGSLHRYASGSLKLPPGFKHDTLIYAVTKVTITGTGA